MDKPVTLAAVAGAHGVTGEVRLKLFGEGVDALKRYGAFNDGALTLKKIRSDHKGGAIARFAEVGDRTAAEKLRGTALTVRRAALPPLGEGEYYHADLIGLTAVSTGGEVLGIGLAANEFKLRLQFFDAGAGLGRPVGSDCVPTDRLRSSAVPRRSAVLACLSAVVPCAIVNQVALVVRSVLAR